MVLMAELRAESPDLGGVSVRDNRSARLHEFVSRELTCISPVPEVKGESLAMTLVREIVGTGQCRSTSCPSAENQAEMMKLTQRCIDQSIPIPVLVPMGPKKPVIGKGIDIAEVCALKTLAALRRRILTRYPHGVNFFFREEDVTGWHLEGEIPQIHECIDNYLSGFELLIKALGYGLFMTPFRESKLTELGTYVQRASSIEPLLHEYIEETDREGLSDFERLLSYQRLSAIGWQGPIPLDQRDFYRQRYGLLYPDRGPREVDAMMVRYLATTLTRYQVHAAFPPEIASGYFQLNFAPPVPGSPKSLSMTRVYWRPLPTSVHKCATPFWRAKGYLREESDRSFCPNLGSWREALPLTPNTIILKNGAEEVAVQADILPFAGD